MKNIIAILSLFVLLLIPKFNIQGSGLEISLYEIYFIFILWLVLLLFDGVLQYVGLYKKGLNNELKPFYDIIISKVIIFRRWDANAIFLIGVFFNITILYGAIKELLVGDGFRIMFFVSALIVLLIGYLLAKLFDKQD
jgi:hypothetical protein